MPDQNNLKIKFEEGFCGQCVKIRKKQGSMEVFFCLGELQFKNSTMPLDLLQYFLKKINKSLMYGIFSPSSISSNTLFLCKNPQDNQYLLQNVMASALVTSLKTYKKLQFSQIQREKGKRNFRDSEMDVYDEKEDKRSADEESLKKQQETKGLKQSDNLQKKQNSTEIIENNPNSFIQSASSMKIPTAVRNSKTIYGQQMIESAFEFQACPAMGMGSNEKVKKLENLLLRKVEDWKEVDKKKKYGRYGESRRQVRMLHQ